jgi:hypothetical protein
MDEKIGKYTRLGAGISFKGVSRDRPIEFLIMASLQPYDGLEFSVLTL